MISGTGIRYFFVHSQEVYMELREIRTFLQVAHSNSFSRAAEELGYSQAAVTIQIRSLEQELETRLFDRIGKQTVLTHNGHVFYEYAAAILKEVDCARAAVSEGKELTGRLCIGTIESICAAIFPELLKAYHRKYPRVSVSIILNTPDVLLERLGRNSIDLVYLLDRRICDSRWKKVMEEPEEIVFVSAAAHPASRNPSLSLDEILTWPFILTEKDASYRFALDQYLASAGKSLKPFLEIGNTEFIVNLVRSGLGLSFLPEYTIRKELEAETLCALRVRDFQMRAWKQILYHKDKWVTREMAAFLELANNSG